MSGIMNDYTLSEDKFYILASQYFIDVFRAAYIIPVDLELIDMLPYGWVADYNNDGDTDVDDFAVEVVSGAWTFSRLAQIAGLITYSDVQTGTMASQSNIMGFAVKGLVSALVYNTNTGMVNREYGSGLVYNDDPAGFKNVISGLSELFSSAGVLYANSSYNVNTEFLNHRLLFGGVTYLANMEKAEYQDMKNSSGIAVLPVPSADGSEPKPVFGTVAALGAISASTSKFTQCTAFLHYQSTNSAEVYYTICDYIYAYDVLDGAPLSVTVLAYIRDNVGANTDQLVDEVMSMYYGLNSWHSLLASSGFAVNGVDDFYTTYYYQKAEALSSLNAHIDALPE